MGSAAEVSTSTAAILTEMIKPGRELSGAIAALGFASSDAMIAQLGFGGAIQALGGYAQDSGKKITNLFASSEAGKVAMSIAGAQADVFNEKLKEMEQSAGAMDAAYAAQTGGINELGAQFEQLKAQVAVSSQNIGQALMPVLRVTLQIAEPLAQSIGAVANTFSALPQPLQNSAFAILGIVAAVGPVTTLAGSFIGTTGKVAEGVAKLGEFASKHKTKIKAIGSSFVSAGGKALVFGKKLGVLGLKGAAHLGRLGLKAGGVAWKISQALGGKYTTGALKFLGLKAFDAGKAVAGVGKKAVIAGWKMSVAFGTKALSGIKTAGKFVFGLGKQFVLLIPKAYAFAAAHWAAWGPAALVVGIVAAVGVATTLLVTHWDKVTAALGRAWGWFSKVLDNPLIATALSVFAPFIAVPALIVKHWDTIKAFGIKVWVGFTQGLKSLWGWFSKVLDNPLIVAATMVFAPFIAVPALIVKHWGKVKDFFGKMFDGIAAGWGKVSGLFSWLPGMGKKSGEALTATVAGGMVNATPQVERAAYGMAYAADQYLPHSNAKKGPLSRLSESGEALVETVQQGAETRNISLEKPLSLPNAKGPAPVPRLADGAERGATNYTIHIENLTIQAEGLENALDFVRALQSAGGWGNPA